MELIKPPRIDIRYGLQTQENQKEWINWVAENIALIKRMDISPNEIREIALQLFEEISQCGYDVGYDSSLH